jgi:hypothetical protein
MTRLHAPSARPRPFDSTPRPAAGAAGLAAAVLLALAGCKGDEAAAMSPAGAALVASAPAVTAVTVPPPPDLQPVAGGNTATTLAAADAKLDSALAGASVCTVDTECHAVAVGAKACGGPTGYRAYSSKTVSQADMEALAQHERDIAAQAARESHEVSTCFMLADPGARCVQHKCVTGRAPPPG